MDIAQTVQTAARMSGDLGIRTLDLQADISELAGRVTDQAATIEAIGGDAVRLAALGNLAVRVRGSGVISAPPL